MSRAAWVLLFVITMSSAPPAEAQRWDVQSPVEASVALGQGRTLWSSVLQEPRQLLISLPANYERSAKAYPVVYLLDGEMQFSHAAGVLHFLGAFNERIPEMILVAIVNTDRGRDFVPPARNPAWRGDPMWREEYERSNPDAFLQFIATELIPWMAERYRTVPYRVLVGHSFGGVFSTHTLINRPDVFQAHIAISPSLWYDGEALVASTEAGIRRLSSPPRLFISWADHEDNIRISTEKLVQALTRKPPPKLQWTHRYYQGEDHMSTPHRALYDGLEWVFAGWRMPRPEEDSGGPSLSQVEAHYAALSQRFGFPVAPPATVLNQVAQNLLQQAKTEDALELLRRNAREHRDVAFTHNALGAALEKLGRREEALHAYEDAVRAALEDDSPYGDPVGDYREKVRKLR